MSHSERGGGRMAREGHFVSMHVCGSEAMPLQSLRLCFGHPATIV